ETVAQLGLPVLADGCIIDMLEEDGSSRTVAAAHSHPELAAGLRDLIGQVRSGTSAGPGVPRVLQSGQTELHYGVAPEGLEHWAASADLRQQLAELGLKGLLIVPLRTRGRTLGTLAFLATRSRWCFGVQEQELAQELAQRAALALDNARLYQATRTAVAR